MVMLPKLRKERIMLQISSVTASSSSSASPPLWLADAPLYYVSGKFKMRFPALFKITFSQNEAKRWVRYAER